MDTQKVMTLTDVPDSDVDMVAADFESEGARVKRQRQSDGNWTIIASFESDQKSGFAA
jgi:hypothetical protein